MEASLWTVTARAPEAARWKQLLKLAGAKRSSRLDSISALSQAGGEKAEGIALVDAALLTGEAAERVRSLREHCPGVQLIVVCEENALKGPDLADALAAGALDYLRSASADDALVDKLRLHIKRLYPRSLEAEATHFRDLRVDWRCRAVEVKAGKSWKEVDALTPKEFDLLRALIDFRNRRVSREDLLRLVWGERSGKVNPESVDKQVGSLRRKLKEAGKRIQTVRGFGYAFKA